MSEMHSRALRIRSLGNRLARGDSVSPVYWRDLTPKQYDHYLQFRLTLSHQEALNRAALGPSNLEGGDE